MTLVEIQELITQSSKIDAAKLDADALNIAPLYLSLIHI